MHFSRLNIYLTISSLFVLAILCSQSLHAQDEKSAPADLRMDRTFDRKAVVPLMVSFGDLQIQDLEALSSTNFNNKLDPHLISTLVVPSGFERDDYMEIPVVDTTTVSKEPPSKTKKFLKNLVTEAVGTPSASATPAPPQPVLNKEKRIALFQEMLMREKIGNEIVATWFDRSPEGVFSVYGTFTERAKYSASELDKIKIRSTVRGDAALIDHADKLVNQTYLVMVDLSKVQSMADYYRAAETKIEDRTKEGYKASGLAHVFKLDFGDSIQSIFWTDLWTEASDDSTLIQSRAAAFDSMNFPFVYVESFGISSSGVQSIKTDQVENAAQTARAINALAGGNSTMPVSTKKTMPELYADCLQSAFRQLPNNLLDKSTKIDFSVKANIIQSDQIAAYIGTKESIRRHKTFFVMEDKTKNDGTLFSKKMGAVRALHVGNNKEVGSDSSTFYQIAGPREPYLGTFLVEKKEVGINLGLSLDRGLLGGMSGPTARVEINISRWAPLLKEAPHALMLYGTLAFDGSAGTRTEFTSSTSYGSYPFTFRTESGPNDVFFSRFAGGLMYERFFGRIFHYNAGLGYGLESTTDLEGLPDDVTLNQGLIDVGANLGVSLLHNLQLEAGIRARVAAGKTNLVYNNSEDDNDKSVSYPIEGSSYGDIFPGRGATVSASLGLKVLL